MAIMTARASPSAALMPNSALSWDRVRSARCIVTEPRPRSRNNRRKPPNAADMATNLTGNDPIGGTDVESLSEAYVKSLAADQRYGLGIAILLGGVE